MASLIELVASPELRSALSFVVQPRSPRDVGCVAFAEDLADVVNAEPGAVVLLSRAASAAAGSYHFEMALRLGRAHEVAALVMAAEDVGQISATAPAVADRSRTAILASVGRPDPAELAIRIGRELAGDAGVAIFGAHAAVRAVQAHPADAGRDALMDRAGAALGVSLSYAPTEPATGPRRAVLVDGQVVGWMTAAVQEGELSKSVDVVLHVVADSVGRAIETARNAAELPIQSQEEALAELLAANLSDLPWHLQRARSAALPVDGWHVVVRIEVTEQADSPSGPTDGYQQRLQLARSTLELLRAGGGTWHTARAASGVLVVRTFREDPGLAGVVQVRDAMDSVVERARGRPAAAIVRCGVGGVHQGGAGLVESAREARAAVVAARASGTVSQVTQFDRVGMRRAVIDWYASATAQEAVSAVLAPLVRLEGVRAERLIQTLHVYLDNQGSVTKTAAALNLHRNAVSYRVHQIFELLEVDPADPDDRLLLQLACRARELP